MTRVAELVLPKGERLRADRYRGLYRVAWYKRTSRHTAQHESLVEALTIVLGELDEPYDPDVLARAIGPRLPRPANTARWAELEPPIGDAELEQELAMAEGRLL